eukprot:1157087-Pelagomonas_calceolata.AAC.17
MAQLGVGGGAGGQGSERGAVQGRGKQWAIGGASYCTQAPCLGKEATPWDVKGTWKVRSIGCGTREHVGHPEQGAWNPAEQHTSAIQNSPCV